MNKKILGLSLALGGLMVAGASQAAVVIDDFSDDSSFVEAPGGETNTLTTSDFAGERVGSITATGRGGSYVVEYGELAISANSRSTATASFSYENAGGFDFTAVTESAGYTGPFQVFFLDLIDIDQGGADVTLTVNGVSSTKFVNQVGTVTFDFADFGDVSNVTSISYEFALGTAVDATFDAFGAYGSKHQVPQVPEPAALALLGLGLAGFGFGRRKAAK